MMKSNWKVIPQCAGQSLLQFLKENLNAPIPVRQIKRAIEGNLCKINGRIERHSSFKLRAGDEITLETASLDQFKPNELTLDPSRILFEDDYLLIYDKPAGVNSDETGLSKLFPDYYMIHRLDKETTGVIILAKTLDVKEKMDAIFHDHKIKKLYMALVDGTPREKGGIVEGYIGRMTRKGTTNLWGIVDKSRGRYAYTQWQRKSSGKEASLVHCYPKTGRTHQIRLHMKEIGHPILGDYRYQRSFRCHYNPPRCMLHAAEVSFDHPATGAKLSVKAPIPEDFKLTMDTVL